MQRRSDAQLVGDRLDAPLHRGSRVRQRRKQVIVSVAWAAILVAWAAVLVANVVQVVHLLGVDRHVAMHGHHVPNHHGLLMHHFSILQQSLSAPSRYSTAKTTKNTQLRQ